MKLILAMIRNGWTESARLGRLLGTRDEPLCQYGTRQLAARAEAGVYPQVTLVYTGEACRCVQSAALAYPRTPAVIVKRLKPFNYGVFEGKALRELQSNPCFLDWAGKSGIAQCPGGDNPYQFQVVCAQAFRGITEEMSAKGIETTAIITHQSVIQMILQRHCIPRSAYRSWDIACGEGYLVEYDTLKRTVKLVSAI